MASALEHPKTNAEESGVTRETPAVSPLVERDRTRAATRISSPGPGRYLAIPDGDEVALVPLREPTTRLGRSHTADVVLEDPSVSRRHALVVRRDGRTVVLDDRSLNGVHVNGERVGQATLRDGDTLAVGDVQMRFLAID